MVSSIIDFHCTNCMPGVSVPTTFFYFSHLTPFKNSSITPKSLRPYPCKSAILYKSLDNPATGNANPSSSPASTAKFKSLSINAVPNPPSYPLALAPLPSSLAAMGCGLFTSLLQHLAVLIFIAPAKTVGSTPKASPRFIASHIPTICAANAALLQSFTADPDPASPHGITPFPILCNKGCIAVKVAGEEHPTMKVNVASVAPLTPPETGAST
mmetsp:Transcript_6549/g.11882  ORF Transcript_6549/g.11882 Transcript_6549/m.11882 type:complete len:213 (-) Transcript_6549:912-1550(-)